MKVATVKLKSTTPYSQSKHYTTPKLDKENARDYEERTWRDRVHTTSDGRVLIPPMSLKNCIAEAAKFLGKQIPGKGKSTYTKHFEAGTLVTDPIILPILKKDIEGEWLFVPSDGIRGSGKRVDKCFPVIREWEGTATFYVIDETITKEVFIDHLRDAGSLIGIGRFRPRNNGFYGRFTVENLEWK